MSFLEEFREFVNLAVQAPAHHQRPAMISFRSGYRTAVCDRDGYTICYKGVCEIRLKRIPECSPITNLQAALVALENGGKVV